MALAKSLSFDTGAVEYDINGAATVTFNPTDEGFVSKLYDTFGALDSLQDDMAQGDDSEDVLDKFARLDVEMRAAIDGLLGPGVSEALFAGMNCYAIADGLPVWMNLVLALLDEVTEAYEREYGKTDARLKAHSAKYDAIIAKYGRRGKGPRLA